MRTLLTYLVLFSYTTVLGLTVIVASMLGVRYRPGNIMDRAPRWWARALLRTAGVTVEFHDLERSQTGEPHIFVSNHVSWFDVLALAAWLPRYKFVAKAELTKIPIFGKGMLAVGTVAIERENRKSAFASYEKAAETIRGGDNVVVYPEGTRGTTYALRPFKKGPFVLAIAAQVPIVPTIVHGTIEINPRGSYRVHRAGTIHVHFLEPVPTAGMTYDDRDALAQRVYDRMAEAMERLYGVRSPRSATRAA